MKNGVERCAQVDEYHHCVSDSRNLSLRNRGKVFPYKKVGQTPDRKKTENRHSHLEKAPRLKKCDRHTERKQTDRKKTDTAVKKKAPRLKNFVFILDMPKM